MADQDKKTAPADLAAAVLEEARAAMQMADDANWGEFCGYCGVLLSLDSQDNDECGQAHTATQLIHAWLERNPIAAIRARPAPKEKP